MRSLLVKNPVWACWYLVTQNFPCIALICTLLNSTWFCKLNSRGTAMWIIWVINYEISFGSASLQQYYYMILVFYFQYWNWKIIFCVHKKYTLWNIEIEWPPYVYTYLVKRRGSFNPSPGEVAAGIQAPIRRVVISSARLDHHTETT